jgi:hypothetical protein
VTRRLYRDQRGQTMAMAVVVLFGMCILVAVVANIGQVVNRKVALQIVADTGAFTGASKMAEGMNYLAYGNAWMQSIYGYWTYAWTATAVLTVDDCEALDGVTGFFNGVFWVFRAPFEFYNAAYANLPYMEARKVSVANVNELFPGEGNRFRFAEVELGDIGSDPGLVIPFVHASLTNGGSARPFLQLASVDRVDEGTEARIKYPAPVPPVGLFPTWQGPAFCVHWGIPPVPGTTDLLQFFFKKSEGTNYFVWHVKAPKTKAFFFDRLFGGTSIPEMRAVAAAKPIGGSIEKGDAHYIAKMVPVRKTMLAPAIYDDKMKSLLYKFRPILH